MQYDAACKSGLPFSKWRCENKLRAVPEPPEFIFYEKRLQKAKEVKIGTGCEFSLATDQELSDRLNIFTQPDCLGMFN